MPLPNERNWTYLAPLKGESVPRNVVFFDTETWPEAEKPEPVVTKHVFRLACASRGRWEKGGLQKQKSERFNHWDLLWTWLLLQCRPRETTWIFAHNLGFDLTVSNFWMFVEKQRINIGQGQDVDRMGEHTVPVKTRKVKPYCVLSDPPTVIHGVWNERSFYLVDSFNYFKSSLADMALSVGMTKLPMPDYAALESEWFRYCENDVAVLQAAVCRLIQWWEIGKYGPWGPTAASLAWNAFRRKFLPEREILCHGHTEVLALERHSYYGGQVVTPFIGSVGEPVDRGEEGHYVDDNGRPACFGPVHVLDVTSLYPYILANFPMPGRLKSTGGNVSMSEVNDMITEYPIVARVRISSVDEDFPCHVEPDSGVPVLNPDKRCVDRSPYLPMQTVFARGHFDTVLCGPELVRAMDTGCVDKIVCYACYEPTWCIAEYVGYFWGERILARGMGDKAWEGFVKMLLNSLSGKFGQRRGLWEKAKGAIAPVPWGPWVQHSADTGQSVTMRSIGWLPQQQTERGETSVSTPIISAYICSAAREVMRSYRSLAGARQVYYQDTDSIHCTTLGFNRLVDSGFVMPFEMGMLRHVYQAARALYCGPKHYRLDGTWTIGGIRASARLTADGAWIQSEWQRLPDVISKRPDGAVRVTEKTHFLRSSHPTGEMRPDGWVYPKVF